MKKFLLTLCGAALVMSASCSKTNTKKYSPEEQAFGDSVAVALGKYAGAQEFENLQRMMTRMSPEEIKAMDKEQFIRGLELVLRTDTSNISFLNGVYAGLNLYNPVTSAEKMTGVPVSTAKVLAAFREVFLSDSLTNSEQYRNDFQAISMRLNEMAQEKAKRAKMESPESQKNIADGEKYIAECLNNGFQKSESGLIYKINNPGEGEKVRRNDKVKMGYVGKHVNGEVFDQNSGMEARVTQFIPGFTEGLTLLAPGGSATIVIPADLAYGLDGSGDKIGPNETLVFEINIDEITTPKN